MIIRADARSIPLADRSVHCCVTSPPYWGLRDYGVAGQLGLERTPEEYISRMVEVFREVKRVLRDDGTLWLNMGDSYGRGSRPDDPKDSERGTGFHAEITERSGYAQISKSGSSDGYVGRSDRPGSRAAANSIKPKDLVGIPWMLALALRADGWYLRSDIIWSKPNGMPESVQDRPTRSHEYIFLLAKSERYFYNGAAIEEPASMASLARWNQDLEKQNGSLRAHAGEKTNGNMKAVGGPDKQRGHSRRHDGFNDRWDAMEKAEQCSGTRQKRDVWIVAPAQFSEAHFATFPEELIKPCILAGCPAGGVVLDPFVGSGTTVLVAKNLQCKGVGLELNAEYIEIAKRRLSQHVMEFV